MAVWIYSIIPVPTCRLGSASIPHSSEPVLQARQRRGHLRNRRALVCLLCLIATELASCSAPARVAGADTKAGELDAHRALRLQQLGGSSPCATAPRSAATT
jgi:hypothetical protein